MTIKNKQVRDSVLRTLNRMILIRDETPGLTSQQKSDIKKTITELKREYVRVAGLSINDSYSSIAGQLSSAKTELKRIKQDRTKLQNQFVTATKILNAVDSILNII